MKSLLREILFSLLKDASAAAAQSTNFQNKTEVVEALGMLVNHLQQCQNEDAVTWLRFIADLLAQEV